MVRLKGREADTFLRVLLHSTPPRKQAEGQHKSAVNSEPGSWWLTEHPGHSCWTLFWGTLQLSQLTLVQPALL